MSGIINSAGAKSGVIGTTQLDYEEGSISTAPNMSGNGSFNVSGYSGQYIKIGGIVHFSFNFTTTGTVSSPVGTIQVPVPFACGYYTAGSLRCYNESFTGSPFLQIGPTNTQVSFYTNINASATGSIVPTSGTRYFIGQITYRIA